MRRAGGLRGEREIGVELRDELADERAFVHAASYGSSLS
jgi:hypothetical protein